MKRLIDVRTVGGGAKLSQLKKLDTEGHADNGSGECNARNKEAHRKRNADNKQPKEISDWSFMEINVYARSARPSGEVGNTEAGSAGGDQDDRKTAKDPYQEKCDRQGKTVEAKPKDIDDCVHCKNLSSRIDAHSTRAIIHIKFITTVCPCQWKKKKSCERGINFVARGKNEGMEIQKTPDQGVFAFTGQAPKAPQELP